MIQSFILEPYRYPKPIILTVTILRGPRRMRFSRQLRKHYQDFAPRLWFLMQRLGYKKFLQRLYIDIDSDEVITHNLYEFPILLAILAEIKILSLPENLITIGRITPNQIIEIPEYIRDHLQNFADTTIFLPEQGVTLLETLNILQRFKPAQKERSTKLFESTIKIRIYKDLAKSENPSSLIYSLLPGVFSDNGYVSLDHTPLTILDKFDQQMLHAVKFVWKEQNSLPNQRLFLWLLQHKSDLNLTIQCSENNKKEREDFFSPLFS